MLSYRTFLNHFNFLAHGDIFHWPGIHSQSPQSATKLHDYSRARAGKEYVLEVATGESGWWMTGQGRGIRAGDSLILNQGSGQVRYRVSAIDYYSDAPELWTALLQRATP